MLFDDLMAAAVADPDAAVSDHTGGGSPIRFRIAGPRAVWKPPELKSEGGTYDVMTPSAAAGILSCIYWKPQMRWVVDSIEVLKPIRKGAWKANEIRTKASAATIRKGVMETGKYPEPVLAAEGRTQRCGEILLDVDYVINAHIELSDLAEDWDSVDKHLSIARRRLRRHQLWHEPYLGTSTFGNSLIEDAARRVYPPHPELAGRVVELDWMIGERGWGKEGNGYIKPSIVDGVVDFRDLEVER